MLACDPHIVRLMDVKQGLSKDGKTVLYLVFEYMDTDVKKDLKPHNLLMDPKTMRLKIADLGLARAFTLPMKKYTHELIISVDLFELNVIVSGYKLYRVEMAVSDASDSALFVAFDAEMNKLINLFVIVQHGTSMEDAHNIAFPQCLRDILGRALTFQQKLSRFNFSSKHQSFTLTRASLPDFAEQVLQSTTADPLLMSWWKARNSL
ncbi:unnamed protein product [Brassica napus]|uniref:(rape) hypothetical protein n=1 Tax=Brassica napus TaxID=3708 RepID=A0A816XBN8_BRANA|nr:unnamed protein product [Brassica napus]CAF2144931.1 unnamed protein product [Brassica napus]